MIIIAGWAHTAEDMSPLCSLLSGKYDIQATSTARLFSKADVSLQALQPGSQYARALHGIITRTGEPPIIVAWSMGALAAITELSARISRLIIISGTARFCAGDDYPQGIPEQNLRAMAASLASRPDEVLTAFFHDAIFPETVKSQEVEKKTRMALSLSREVLLDGLSYLRHADVRRDLPKIHVPTLVIHGRQDKIIPLSAGEFLKNHIVDSRLVIHENAGHTLILDQPAMIAENIRTFVEA
jgi:pimeloyl-[acyl-carrier protein] methyl ester esterase